MNKTVSFTLASAVATGGTFTVGYPEGTTNGNYDMGARNYLMALQSKFSAPEDITLSFGTSLITVTYNGATTLPAGSEIVLHLDRVGGDQIIGTDDDDQAFTLPDSVSTREVITIDLGSPLAADADGVAVSQSVAGGADFDIDGALAVDGVVDLGSPRNIVAAWTSTAVVTVTGTDALGNTVVESSAAGTSFTGGKGFKTITSVTSSSSITLATVGTGEALGLPVPIFESGAVLDELEDGVSGASGTLVLALTKATKSTATTGDVRGTYEPATACDGDTSFGLVVTIANPLTRGNKQFAG